MARKPAPDEQLTHLDAYGDATVSYGEVYHSYKHLVQGVHIYKIGDGVHLEAKQALALLAWLKQQEADLQRLAQEQTPAEEREESMG